ncbi:MAG: hypothetical protein K9M51_00055 [Candidatus Gracilibacteria bacterium]|nr:hypothetical protein [Candidatus Gracilibacteria bacterium]
MKYTTYGLSVFLIGLFSFGFVFAQETTEEPSAAPTMLSDEMPMMMQTEMPQMQDCMMMGQDWKGGHGDCPMMKQFSHKYDKGFASNGTYFLWKMLKGICVLVFLFLGAFVIRLGWALGSPNCCKPKKK